VNKYSLPKCLVGRCTQQQYTKWLQRKAAAHVRRDKKRQEDGSITISKYKQAIHGAVCAGGDRDFYTGESLDWSLISKYRNKDSSEGKKKYKRLFAHLPSVDHTFDEQGELKFVICSWLVNDSKSDMTLPEFYALCESVLQHREMLKCLVETSPRKHA
jgi:hypothetical protein